MKKVSVHLGISRFDKKYYEGNVDLRGCENDGKFYEYIAKEAGYDTNLFLSEQATFSQYNNILKDLSKDLNEGDYLFFTASCHGTYLPTDKTDNERMTALCLYDKIVWDYETKKYLKGFKEGVNIIWITDCCHSRDNFKFIMPANKEKDEDENLTPLVRSVDVSNIKGDINFENYEESKLLDLPLNIVAYSSSNEYQVSYDLKSFVDKRPMGLFTACIEKALLENGMDKFTYKNLYSDTARRIALTGYPQSPALQTINGGITMLNNPFLK
jgi:hypothetical protein